MDLFSNKNLPSKLLLKINLWSSCPCNINQVLNKNQCGKNIREKTKNCHAKKLVESVPQPTKAAPCLARRPADRSPPKISLEFPKGERPWDQSMVCWMYKTYGMKRVIQPGSGKKAHP